MRLYVQITGCELKIIENATGFRKATNFIRGRIERLAMSLPILEEAAPTCALQECSITIKNGEVIDRIERYCEMNNITRAGLVRRLAVDPVVLRHLMGEALDV